MGTNEETCMKMEIEEPEREVLYSKEQQQELLESSAFDIENPILENNHSTPEMLIDELEPSIIEMRSNKEKDIRQENRS
ncbi:44568_t:CDS:2 [Gigaspora margarita]|uniref:44568_t:CDS:1 n=1 Tax=Gigaspora margarita TaxID=4874 RepID=A0ABN7VYM9_GIGMA|nr:44568_t:CDS:2 [Gigaspora margarita]